MPKEVFTPRPLPYEKPDRCELCPLCGIIPKEQRVKGKREKYWCLGIFEAEKDEHGKPVLDENGVQQMSFPRLSSRKVNNVSAKQRKEKGHPIHRPCDLTWDSWQEIASVFSIPTDVYNAYRLPFEREQMIKKMPQFKFRQRQRKKK